MATGNLFLGTARRKVGDVVLYRREGVQVSRVRVRSIANPKTTGQALQRNYMAPIARFYAPLAGVLERSWEGLNRSRSYSAFLKRNLELARDSGWYVPKGSSYVALPYKVSQGSLASPSVSANFSLDDGEGELELALSVSSTLATFGLLSSHLMSAYNLVAGDQVTVIIFTFDNGEITPRWGRFFLDPDSANPITDIMPGIITSAARENSVIQFTTAEDNVCGGAVIFSRWDSSRSLWLRSNSYVSMGSEYMAMFTGEAAYQRAIDSYRNGSTVNVSDIYLNGATGDNTAAASLFVNAINSELPDAVIEPVRLTVSGSFATVLGRNIANGAAIQAFIVDRMDGSPNPDALMSDGRVWDPTSTVDTLPDDAYWIDITQSGSSAPINAWLIGQGVDYSVFG